MLSTCQYMVPFTSMYIYFSNLIMYQSIVPVDCTSPILWPRIEASKLLCLDILIGAWSLFLRNFSGKNPIFVDPCLAKNPDVFQTLKTPTKIMLNHWRIPIEIWLVVWNMFFPFSWESSSQLLLTNLSLKRGVGQPATSTNQPLKFLVKCCGIPMFLAG